jgi:DNA-binding response OmpR family regulator
MHKTRALVVEDEFQIGLDIQSALSDAGFDVVGPIVSVDEAVEQIGLGRFDVAVLDANLNGRNAGAVAELLIERNVPFVVVSGYAREHLPLCMAGAPLLAKPFDPTRLVALVQRACTGFVIQHTSDL